MDWPEELSRLLKQIKPTMDYDEILNELGQFSKWHWLQYSIILLFPVTGAFATLSFSFTGLEPNAFRCLIPECQENPANASVLDFGSTIFWHEDDGKIDYCRRYPLSDNFTIYDECGQSNFNVSVSNKDDLFLCDPNDSNQIIIYDEFGMDSTAATKFNLVCDNQYKVSLAGSIYMGGLLVGSYLFGSLSDLIGRKKASFVALLVTSIGLLCTAFAPEYISFSIARFVTGIGGIGVFAIPFNLSIELVGNKYKTFTGLFFHTPYAIGQVILGLVAIGVRDYQIYQIVISIPCFIMLGLYFVIPESPRWLIARMKYLEAEKIIKKAEQFNQIQLSPQLFAIKTYNNTDQLQQQSSTTLQKRNKEPGITGVFLHSECRKDTLVMGFAWIATNLAYFGLNLCAGDLSDNIYLSFILLGLVELPALIAIWFLDHWGRKPTLVVSFLLCGICCICAAYTTGTLKLVLALIGKCGSAGCFDIIYNYTAEMYPTVVRTTGLGFCSMAGRFGGIAAPLVALYIPVVAFEELPLLIFGATTFIAAMLCLLLPETLGAPLIESLDELMVIRKHAKPLLSWWSTTQVCKNVEKISSLRYSDSQK